MQDLINGRCGWCGTDELYVKYHDQEWGKLSMVLPTKYPSTIAYIPDNANAIIDGITYLKNNDL